MFNNEKIILKSKTYVHKFDSILYSYDVDGIKVVFLDNKIQEYAFCATVYNNHMDNRGLPHLTEHCIFGGSKNYDIEEPFEYLVQNEKYNYLNAITFRDRTACLFSTYSKKSFFNIFDVYMDSIFNPLLRGSTFTQECFRLETGEKGELIKNGIAYNEMLDMYNDESYLKENKLFSNFDGNYFKFNAHGNPKDIEQVTNDDVVKYYNNNFTKDNILLTFYGNLEHEQILNYVYEISKNTSITSGCKQNNLELFTNGICMENDEKTLDIGIAYKNDNYLSENLKVVILNTVFSKTNVAKWLKLDEESLTIEFTADSTSEYTLIKISLKTVKTLMRIKKQEVEEFLSKGLDDLDFDLLCDNILKKIISTKTKDYGYKTVGIFDLLEISKRQNIDLEYYASKNINNYNILEFITNTISDLKTDFSLFSEKIVQSVPKQDYLHCVIKKNKEKFDKLFEKCTKYDIIDIIIIIKFNNFRQNCVKSFNLNELHDYCSVNNFDITNQYLYWLNDKNNTLYVNLRILSLDYHDFVNGLSELFKSNNLRNVLLSKDNSTIKLMDKSYDNSNNINYLIEKELELYNENNETAQTDSNICKLEWEIFSYKDLNFNLECEGKSTLNLTDFGSASGNKELELCNSEQIKEELDVEKLIINPYKPSGVYKNILILDYGAKEEINNFYIELVLEAFINEKLYKIVRLQNGAYEVNYKLLKLENKVVLYSNIDKYSKKTLEIFKKEFNNLNKLSFSEIKKYSNKIINNFHRNEQNKNMKVYKDFVNYITNSDFKNRQINEVEVAEAIKILQSAKVVLEKSYS